MRRVNVLENETPAGYLDELEQGRSYIFSYLPDYQGSPVSLTMPVNKTIYRYDRFPPFFEGLLPEGLQLEALLRSQKIDAHNYFSQLIAVGGDLIGSITVTLGESDE